MKKQPKNPTDKQSAFERRLEELSQVQNNQDDKETSLTQVLEEIAPDEDKGKVSIGDIMTSLDSAGFGPLLFAPALIAVMPTGGIPGVPTVCGLVIILLSIQIVMGKSHPWMPNFINNIDFENEKLDKGIGVVRKVTKQLDKVTKPRLEKLSSNLAKKIIAVLCILAGLSMMPLELVPFAVMIPASSIILFAIGLVTEDGYIISGALILNLITLYVVVTKGLDAISSFL